MRSIPNGTTPSGRGSSLHNVAFIVRSVLSVKIGPHLWAAVERCRRAPRCGLKAAEAGRRDVGCCKPHALAWSAWWRGGACGSAGCCRCRPPSPEIVLPRRLWLDERKDRDAIAAYRTEPEFVGDLNGGGSDAEPIDIGVANEFLDPQRGRIDLHNVRCLRRRSPSLASGKQRAVRGPSEIVETKANRNTVPLNRRLPARQANERLAAPSADVQPLTVFGDLQTVRTGCFATWHFLPSGVRVPFPDLTVDLARHHSFARSRISAPRQEVCGDKPAVGQTNYRIQADWIGRNRTSNPGQRRRLGPGVEFENFDRFPAAMMNDVEGMDRVLPRAQV